MGVLLEDPTFEDVAELVRKHAQLSRGKQILQQTQFERDLGITGDDGDELLQAAEKQFGVTFTRETFNLEPNEFLFGPEASLVDVITLFKHRKSIFRPFTVGELCEAIRKELKNHS